MARVAYWKRNPEALVRRLQKAEKNLLVGKKDAVSKLSRRFDRELAKKTKTAVRVNRQDSGNGTILRPPQVRPFRVEQSLSATQAKITLELRSHWVGARTKGVLGALRYLGFLGRLERTGLWVAQGKPRKMRARDWSGPFKFLSFASNPRLEVWVERSDKGGGNQMRRHVIELNAKMLEALLMGPVIRKNAKFTRAAWRALLKEWKKP